METPVITRTGYELVSIVEQQNISMEILEVVSRSDLFAASSTASPSNIWSPKGGGGSLPGGTNALTASVTLFSARIANRVSK